MVGRYLIAEGRLLPFGLEQARCAVVCVPADERELAGLVRELLIQEAGSVRDLPSFDAGTKSETSAFLASLTRRPGVNLWISEVDQRGRPGTAGNVRRTLDRLIHSPSRQEPHMVIPLEELADTQRCVSTLLDLVASQSISASDDASTPRRGSPPRGTERRAGA